MDDILNQRKTLTSTVSITAPVSNPKTASDLLTSQGGDKMDIFVLNSKGQYTRARGSYRYHNNRNNSDKKSNHKTENHEVKSTPRAAITEQRLEARDGKCFHCKGTGHVKKDCVGWKKLKAALERAKGNSDMRVVELLSSDEEDARSGKD